MLRSVDGRLRPFHLRHSPSRLDGWRIGRPACGPLSPFRRLRRIGRAGVVSQLVSDPVWSHSIYRVWAAPDHHPRPTHPLSVPSHCHHAYPRCPRPAGSHRRSRRRSCMPTITAAEARAYVEAAGPSARGRRVLLQNRPRTRTGQPFSCIFRGALPPAGNHQPPPTSHRRGRSIR